MARGLFISFEGIEGAGKSTQVARLAHSLRQRGYDVKETREPGGSPAAEAVRHVLLSCAAEKDFGPDIEAILFAAARYDHVKTIIQPAIRQGKILLCDRFIDSSYVYQNAEEEQTRQFITALQHFASRDTVPDCTIILDLPAAIGLDRARQRQEQKNLATGDRFEKEHVEIHEKRRQSFLQIAKSQPQRCYIVDAMASFETMASHILAIVDAYLLLRGLKP